jgi:hypothetical protein
MAWETRKGGRYFYRAVKKDGRVIKTYIGRGLPAEIAAGHLTQARERRLDQEAAYQAERARLALPTQALADLDAACSLMVEATLTAAGFHKVDSKWRRKRDVNP